MLGQIEAEYGCEEKSDKAFKKRVQLRSPYLYFYVMDDVKILFWIAKNRASDVKVIRQLKWNPTRFELINWENCMVLNK